MKQTSKEKSLYLCQAAMIAAFYVALTFFAQMLGLGSGMIQVRFSEALCLLPILLPAAIPGLTVGCFLANLLTGAVWLDILVGPIATLIGAIGTYLLRKNRVLATLLPILSNMILIPPVLAYGYGMEDALWFMMITVGIGEIISVGLLGNLFFQGVKRTFRKK